MKEKVFFNFFNWFKLRNLIVLCVTLVLSFSIRLFIVKYFNWDFTIFGDFFILGFYILGCVCDYLFCPSLNMFFGHFKCINFPYRINKLSLYRNNNNNNSGVSDNVNSSLDRNDSFYNNNNNNNDNRMESFKDKVKRRLFWVMWKQYGDDFNSYEDYKQSVNRVVSARGEIKKDLEKEFPNLFRRTRKIAWFVKHINRKR